MQSLTTVTKRTRPASKSMAEIELALRRVMISFPTEVGSHVITLAPPTIGPKVTLHACHVPRENKAPEPECVDLTEYAKCVCV